MKKYLLPEGGNFYKANLHVHTDISDGDESPETVKRMYKDMGYSVVAFTDHEVMVPHPELADEDFLPLTSYEIAVSEDADDVVRYGKKVCHMNLYAPAMDTPYSSVFREKSVICKNSLPYITDEMRAHSFPREYGDKGMNEIIKRANDEGFLVSLNHPVWSLQNYEDYKGLEGLWAVEVRNTECVSVGYEDTAQPFEDMVRLSKGVFPIATDDAHHVTSFGKSHIRIKAEKLDYPTIMAALKKGDFYASWGPELKELYVEDNTLHFSCSGVVAAHVISERRRTMSKTSDVPFEGGSIDLTRYLELTADRPRSRWPYYLRLVLIDRNGNKALTRAYMLEELM